MINKTKNDLKDDDPCNNIRYRYSSSNNIVCFYL